MCGPADQHIRTDDLPGDRKRQVILAEMQDVGPRRAGDIGTVVDREQRAVTCGGRTENSQVLQFFGGLKPPELLLAD